MNNSTTWRIIHRLVLLIFECTCTCMIYRQTHYLIYLIIATMQLKAEERNMNTTVLCKHEIDDSRDISINCNACLYT